MRATPTVILALSVLLPLCASAQSAGPKQVYKMKSDDPRIGTHLKHNVATASLPYDKTYAELSDDDKRTLRALYEHMGPDDEPPFPLRGYKAIFKALSAIQGRLQASGMLEISVMVDANGEGTSVKIYSSPDPEMTRVVATLMMMEKYKPALCSGQPCEQEVPPESQLRPGSLALRQPFKAAVPNPPHARRARRRWRIQAARRRCAAPD